MSTSTVFSNMSISDAIDRFAADAAFVDVVTESYATSDKGGKSAIRAFVTKVEKGATRALLSGKIDSDTVVRITDLSDGLVTVSEKAPIDVSVTIGTLVRNHLEAALRLMAGNGDFSALPDGTDVPVFGDETDIAGIRDVMDNMDLPDFEVETVNRYTTVRIGRKARENDIPDLIREAFETVPNGTFMRIADIRTTIGRLHPNLGVTSDWDGRVAAALFVNNGGNAVEGVEAVANGKYHYNVDIHDKHGKNGAFRDFS
jgi:hypothetical protein